MSNTRNYITLSLTVLMALAFLYFGYLKVSGNAGMVQGFYAFGLPDWFRLATGGLELTGAILLLVPATTGMAGFGLSIIMIGAIACHAMFTPLSAALPAFTFFVILTYIYLTRKKVVPVFLQKLLIS